nr:ribonuclease H-like domain-containing protein [Tanacetum cinerariifolium]
MAATDVEFRCFVGGLAWDTSNWLLEEAFSQYGEIIDSNIITNHETKKSRGFRFVIFKHESSLREAIEGMNGQSLDGRNITVIEDQSRSGGGGGRRFGDDCKFVHDVNVKPSMNNGLVQQAPPNGPIQTFPTAASTGSAGQESTFGAWNMDTCASSHINNSVTSLSKNFNTCMYPSISVGDGHSILVTNTGHSILPTPLKSLHLNNVLITPHIVKNLISVSQFVCDNNCSIEFDVFGFSVKDFMTRRVLLRCDSTGDLYPVTAPSPIPYVFLASQYTWHQRFGHPGSWQTGEASVCQF